MRRVSRTSATYPGFSVVGDGKSSQRERARDIGGEIEFRGITLGKQEIFILKVQQKITRYSSRIILTLYRIQGMTRISSFAACSKN